MSNPPADRSHWPQCKCGSFEEMRRFRIAQWQVESCEARMQAAWDLVTEYWIDKSALLYPEHAELARR